jgi:hypothetical protein
MSVRHEEGHSLPHRSILNEIDEMTTKLNCRRQNAKTEVKTGLT